MPFRKRIAVVGSGISGLSAAWLLAKDHEVVLYEAAGRLGGHSNTVTVPVDGRDIPVDTGTGPWGAHAHVAEAVEAAG